MIGKVYLLVPVALTAGFVGGFGSRQFREHGPPAAGEPPVASAPTANGPTNSPSSTELRSADTVESLLKLDDPSLYQRLALWLLDADLGQIAAFFAGYQKQPEPDAAVLKLLFARWTKLDPAGAFKAAKTTDHEGAAWWAWAINDPEAAVRDVPKEFFGDVVQALSRFHPERVDLALAAHPEFSIWSDSDEIARELARSDPSAALQLLRANGDEDDTRVIEDWTRRDPHAVLEWLEEHPDRTDGSFEDGFLEALEKEHPELLAELATHARSGMLKWQLEAAAFRHLAQDDPAAALAMAQATESLRVKAERLATLGRESIKIDPQQALARFAEVFSALPDAAERTAYVRSTGESDDDGGEPIAGLDAFVEELVATDPRAAMEAAVRGGAETTELVADEWSSEDLDGFSTWLLEQPAGSIRDRGSAWVVRRLKDSADFPGAIAWATVITEPNARAQALTQVIVPWSDREPDAAKAWLDGAELSESDREHLNEVINFNALLNRR